MIVTSEFQPAKGLANADLQTVFPTLARLRTKLIMRRERIELQDGDFLDLEWVGDNDSKPIVILLHGMAGNAHSPYIKGMLNTIQARGWRGVMMYYRGCSEQTNRLPVTYHFGRTTDFEIVLQHIQQTHPKTPLYAIGFSMGGNILLKWLGEHPTQKSIQAAVAISPPYDLRSAAVNIRRGKGRLYQWLLMRDLRQYVNRKYNYPSSPVNMKAIKKVRSFWDLDEKITAPLNGFKHAVDYYQQSSCKAWLKKIDTETLILHALDDPMIPASTVPTEQQLSDHIRLELSSHGGHVGFVSGSIAHPIFWSEDRTMNYLQAQHGKQPANTTTVIEKSLCPKPV